MRSTSPVGDILTTLGGAVLLWTPILLLLTLWIDPVLIADKGGITVHMSTATVLALVGAHLCSQGFSLPLAAPGPGRYRVIPCTPHRPGLMANSGMAALLFSAWSASLHGVNIWVVVAAPLGFMALWMANHWRLDPLWGTWMELSGKALRVYCPRAESWSVPLTHAIALHVRPRDGSFVLETPWPERDVFVPSRGVARYLITDHQSLFVHLAKQVPIREGEVLPKQTEPDEG